MKQGIIQTQLGKALESERYALILAMVLAAIPYMGWLAEALIAFVTLRKGAKVGVQLLLPVILVHTLLSVFAFPVYVALTIATLNVLPCFVAAWVLKKTKSWQQVAFSLFGLVVLGVMLLHLVLPSFIAEQFKHLEMILEGLSSSTTEILGFWQQKGISREALANYLVGIQATSIVFSSLIPVFLARSIQAQLFYPGGFRKEVLHFRANKYGLFVFFALSIAAFNNVYLAMNLLPIVLFYYVLAGLSVGAYMFSRMRPLVAGLILIVPLILIAWVMMPLYFLIGIIDSLCNARVLMTSKMKEV